ncbi:MAG TPA: glycosyltransferase family 2 protein [Candidatus Limnocylindrales bacterium]|nr:glycosyltransferase family 2 protein [Candidatus Limnocylindrales bacterium]
MNQLSVCLVAQNEQENLPRLLRSVQGIADEIVVVDGGSSDRTQEVARTHGAKVFFRAFTNHADQKNYAASLASHEWIFLLDADEELSEELKASVRNWKTHEAQFGVYEMPRLTCYLGAWIRHSRWYPDYQRRIYRRDKASFGGVIHSALRYDGDIGRLRGSLLHYTVRTFQEHEAKLEKYTTAIAKEMFDEGRRDWRAAMWLAAPWSWFRHFILGAGFLDGRRGAVIARMAARGVRLKFKKLGALVEAEKHAGNRGAA